MTKHYHIHFLPDLMMRIISGMTFAWDDIMHIANCPSHTGVRVLVVHYVIPKSPQSQHCVKYSMPATMTICIYSVSEIIKNFQLGGGGMGALTVLWKIKGRL